MCCRYDLLPFCYMSFYVADRTFYGADVAAGLYHSSAYYSAQMLAGVGPAHSLAVVRSLCSGACYSCALRASGVPGTSASTTVPSLMRASAL